MQLHITDVGYGGAGVARGEDGVVFVPGAFVGETVQAELVSKRKRFAQARLLRVLEPSPDRIEPETAVVPGMAYAALRYPAEVDLKHRQLHALLTRIGRLADPPLLPPVPSPLRDHYRNKLTLHWDGRALGYVGDDNRTVLDTPHCPLSQPEINLALADLRRDPALRRLRPGARVVFRHTAHDGVRLGLGKPPAGTLVERLAGLDLSVAADAFFQVNLPCAELLLDAFREAARGARAVLDLYCGCGLFGLVAAQAGATRLFGVETTPSAVRSAARNAAALGLDADYRCVPAEELPEGLPPADLWVVDPPRAGLSDAVRARLLRDRPPRLAYVSCGPDTLARDLAALAPAYALRSVRLFDFFPRTPHFETLALLERKD